MEYISALLFSMHKRYTLPSSIENLLKKSWPKVNYANIEMVKKGQNKRSSRSLRHMRQFLSFFEWVFVALTQYLKI